MCRRIIRQHAVCKHTHEFTEIECSEIGLKKHIHEKRSYWSRLFRPEPSCKVILERDSRESRCPFCTRQRNSDYLSDNYGIDLVDTDRNTYMITTQGSSREVFSSVDPNRYDMTMPEIQTTLVDPGIDMERWSHVRDHLVPPIPGPPPNRRLPPTPTRGQTDNVQSRQSSVPQGRQQVASGHRIARKPVAGQRSVGHDTESSHQVDGPAGTTLAFPRPKFRKSGPPRPLILDKDREISKMTFLPEPDLGRPLTFSFLRDDESSRQEPQTSATTAEHLDTGINQGREKPNKWQASPVSPLTPPPTMRHVDGPNRRAQTTSGRYENVLPAYGDMAYISPKLEQRIDEVEKSWIVITRESEERYEMRIRAETEPIQQKETRGKSKMGRRVQFDDVVRKDTRFA